MINYVLNCRFKEAIDAYTEKTASQAETGLYTIFFHIFQFLILALCDTIRLESHLKLILLLTVTLFGYNCRVRASIVCKANPDLADMHSITLTVLCLWCRHQERAFWFQWPIAVDSHLKGGVGVDGGVISSPKYGCALVFAQARYLTRIELELA